tara:strand:- start:153 stop:419 length:267 start_codon:yes stop_codon:yes gene_type:complete
MVSRGIIQTITIPESFIDTLERFFKLIKKDEEFLEAIRSKERTSHQNILHNKNNQLKSPAIRFLIGKYMRQKEVEELGKTEDNNIQES